VHWALTITVLLLIGSIASVAVNSIQSIEAASKGRVSNDCVPLSASGNNVYLMIMEGRLPIKLT
jgi:hypothetical protein